MPKKLSCHCLSIAFTNEKNSQTVVDNISFDLDENSILGIVGESGSGKTLTSLALMGLLPKNSKIISGQILFNKESKTYTLSSLSQSEWEKWRGNRISMIFQEPMTALNPLMVCGLQVGEVLKIHTKLNPDEIKNKVINLFERVKLPEPEIIFAKYPHQLSGGQKQRVMIAMAIACEPDIIIADEPTTALDVSVQKDIILLLKTLVNSTTSLIFISHDLGLIAETCDNILVMYKGKVVELGTKNQVIHEPKHPYTKALLACRPASNMTNEWLPSLKDIMNTDNVWTSTQKQEVDYAKFSTELLKIENVNVHYEDHYHAVKNASFNLFKGEILGIVGESGSGKSTLANACIGLIKTSSGKIIYNNKNISHPTKREWKDLRKDLQLVFQDPYSSLNPKIKIGDAILEVMQVNKTGGKNNADRKSSVLNLLSDVGLQEKDYYKYPHEFSGGQRQRIVIARALAVKPKLLVCDESVSALDVSVQAQILNLLKKLQRQYDLSILFISHDLSVIRFMCSRILVMQNGKIIEENYSEKIFHEPQTSYTKMLIQSIPEITQNKSRAVLR